MFYRFELRLKVRRYNFTYNGNTNWKVYRVNICFVRIPFQAPLYTHTIMTSVAIFQYHKRMELTFHNLSVIPEFVPSTVIFWTELSCWRKIYSNKTTFLLSCRHRYKNIWSSSRSGWPLRTILRYDIQFNNMLLNEGYTVAQQVFMGFWRTITLNVILTINNAKSKDLPSSVTKWLPN